jgi:hypothetical protein
MKPLYLSDDRELPAVYTATKSGGRWYAESAWGRPHDRRYDRRDLRSGDVIPDRIDRRRRRRIQIR